MRSDRSPASRRLPRAVRTLLQRQRKVAGGPGREHRPLVRNHKDHLVETVLDTNSNGGHASRQNETRRITKHYGGNE